MPNQTTTIVLSHHKNVFINSDLWFQKTQILLIGASDQKTLVCVVLEGSGQTPDFVVFDLKDFASEFGQFKRVKVDWLWQQAHSSVGSIHRWSFRGMFVDK